MLVTPPAATLTDEAFRQQVAALAAAHGPQVLACTSITHTPAFTLPVTQQAVGELAYYNVQVWDITEATPARTHGTFCFVAQGETAAACLATLRVRFAELAERELLALAADPTRFGSQQLASHLALTQAA